MVKALLRHPLLITLILAVRAMNSGGQAVPPDTALTLLFCGDIMNHDAQIKGAFDPVTGAYSYDTCFHLVRDILSEADICIANLEVTFGGKPYTGYPQFSAPDELGTALKKAGIDILVTANNHTYDRNAEGFERTHHVLDSLGFRHTGTFPDSADYQRDHPLLIEIKGFRLALLNYTYGTNGNLPRPPHMISMLDEERIIGDMKMASGHKPDLIIVVLHWGTEYELHPREDQVRLAQNILDHGADILVGSHPHVVQRMERSCGNDGRERILAYSLGNFISNQRTHPRDGGAMLQIRIFRDQGQVHIGEAGYYLTWVDVSGQAPRKVFRIIPVSQPEQVPGSFPVTDPPGMLYWVDDVRSLMEKGNAGIGEICFEPVTGRWRTVVPNPPAQKMKDR
ncbi:MAG: CapA family protein [Bacteroidales bacterium]|nr:CapA family protein [Bacteroidales bacterium]